jgi:hypothetical protein
MKRAVHLSFTGWACPCLRLVCRLCAASLCTHAAAQSVSNTGSLSFGTFVATSAGTVTVGADGSRARSGGTFVLHQGSNVAAPAQFSVQGAPNVVYAITLPADNTVLMSDGAGHSMSVRAFVSNLNGTNILSKNGSGRFNVGATLSVGAQQAKGSYTGTFSVIVNYQ